MKTKNTKKFRIITEALALSLLMGKSAFAQTVSEARDQRSHPPTTSQTSARSGTGVGNGDFSDRETYINQIKTELMAALIPGDSDYHNYLSWCSQIPSVLQDSLNRANNQMQEGRMQLAVYTLVDALIGASRSMRVDPEQSGPMTRSLIERALVYFQSVDSRDLITQLSFLQGSFNFIITTSNDFDRSYYIPYHYNGYQGRNQPGFDLGGYERNLVTIASWQLDFIDKTFTEACVGNVPYRNCPQGDGPSFLKITEFLAAFVADDLRKKSHYANQSRNIADLLNLSKNLKSYNNFRDRTLYRKEAVAVDRVSTELKRIWTNIQYSNYPRN